MAGLLAKGEFMRNIRRSFPEWLGVVLSAALVVFACGTSAPAQKATLDELVSAVVRIKTHINPDGRTVENLGREREGSGVVIDEKGLVLTIGYLMVEAHAAEVITNDGRAIPANIVGYDQETGFGLLQAIAPLKVKPLPLGKSADVKEREPVVVASFGGLDKAGRTRGFQLWVALPPELELGPTISIYQAPEDVPEDGPARVLLGSYRSTSSAIESPSPINYLAVRLKAGEHWRYAPPAGHTVLWVAIASGVLSAPDVLRHGDLAAFEPSSEAVEFKALSDTEFVLGSAAPHEHDLVLGYYSVHTSPDALRDGDQVTFATPPKLGAHIRFAGDVRHDAGPGLSAEVVGDQAHRECQGVRGGGDINAP
jgi:hypothetical protein